MEPPAIYYDYWQETEGCSHLIGDYYNVRWYIVPGASFATPNTNHAAGYWMPNNNIIYIAEYYVYYPRVVRHEMLHSLLNEGGHYQREWRMCYDIITLGTINIGR